MNRVIYAVLTAFSSGVWAAVYGSHLSPPRVGPTPAAVFSVVMGIVALAFVYLHGQKGCSS